MEDRRVAQKLPWAKIDPWYLARWSNKVKTSKNRAKPLKEDQKLPWVKIDPWNTKGLVENFRGPKSVSYTHLRAHETPEHLVCRLLLEKKKKKTKKINNRSQ